MKFVYFRGVILPTVCAFITATVFVMLLNPTLASFQENHELDINCSKFKYNKNIEQKVVIDIESDVVLVTDILSNNEEVEVKLPLKKTKTESDYSECSSDAKDLLKKVQTDYVDYIKESCDDFYKVINGEKAIPEKNGIKANINGAKDFVDKFCK